MISQDGIIDVAEFCPSPNFDERPKNAVIDLIVIHAISLPVGSYNTQLIKDLFLNCLDSGKDEFLESIKDLKVSSHFLITRKGALIQFVPTHKRAWHAGISAYKGRENCNDFSIGIELEGCDDEEFEKPQYYSLSRLINFPISSKLSPFKFLGLIQVSSVLKILGMIMEFRKSSASNNVL